ncbi:MAG TPA: lytic transglycosylase domain-containing protein [Devosia sp.]|nr:lytic transglycosylase domain-containing protein [Devosia sp.]
MRPFLLLLLLLIFSLPGRAAMGAASAEEEARSCFSYRGEDGWPRHACISADSYSADVCDTIDRSARSAGLPPAFFARLIWQESRFDPNALSHAGAQGIAQFMPETGRLQGLTNAFNPAEALWRSARYLGKLRDRFGNLGLAAAAYNGGENRLSRFVAGSGYLPGETLDYVQIITGRPVTDWLDPAADDGDFALQADKPFREACIELADTSRIDDFTPITAQMQPWGIQVAEFFNPANTRRAFSRIQAAFPAVLGDEELMMVARRNPNFGRTLRYIAQVGRETRQAAEALCDDLRDAGGTCIVVRN